MNKNYSFVFAALVVTAMAPLAVAGNPPQTGRIVSENSVNCGEKKHGKKELDLVCQEYVMRTASTEYHIRQPKQNDQALLTLNSDISFETNKDKLKFKSGGKKFEFLVVSMAALAPEAKP
jgi:hypothetical protein